jgi:DNA-binding transcriptional LysR family regulator
MDLDLANVRAFVVVAHELHFGRAAAKLYLSQQGLSKRISRLETSLGVTLFLRAGGSVSLTDAGTRFRPHAERLVEMADAAVAASQPWSASPLRVDVWGHVQEPLRLVRRIMERNEDVQVEISMRRSTAAALDALQRGEIDAAFGNVDHLDSPIPPEVDARRVCYGRVVAIASVDHPLAALPAVSPADLARYPMTWPRDDGASEMRHWVAAFARAHGIALDLHGRNLVEHLVDSLVDDPGVLSLYGLEWPIAPEAPVRVIPIVDPVPLYPWSLVWLPANTHPRLPELVTEAIRSAPSLAEHGDLVWTGATDP